MLRHYFENNRSISSSPVNKYYASVWQEALMEVSVTHESRLTENGIDRAMTPMSNLKALWSNTAFIYCSSTTYITYDFLAALDSVYYLSSAFPVHNENNSCTLWIDSLLAYQPLLYSCYRSRRRFCGNRRNNHNPPIRH